MSSEIPKDAELRQGLFAIHNEKDFLSIARQVYEFQYASNSLYRSFCDAVSRTPAVVKELTDIPFLPISFFKTHPVRTTSFHPEIVFTSSGTTGATTSRHEVKNLELYRDSFLRAFELFFGSPTDWVVLALLPSYLERTGSSLIYMAQHLIEQSRHPESGFYLDDFQKLSEKLADLESQNRKILLLGVTFALLDFARHHPQKLKNTIVMETGGMKGRGRELTRHELYLELKKGLGLTSIHSEYGMTELLSQAYAIEGRFQSPPWMQVLLRDETDPFALSRRAGRTGGINVVDLANLYSCSFIATEDVGRLHGDGSFEVLGRMDHSDIRGCSLLTV